MSVANKMPPSSLVNNPFLTIASGALRYFSSYSLSASKRGSKPKPGVSGKVTQP